MSEPPSIFTTTSMASLAGVLAIYIIAQTGAKRLLPKDASWTDKATFIWMVTQFISYFSVKFDAYAH